MAQKKTYIMAENELQKPEGADVEFYSGDVTGLVKRLRGRQKRYLAGRRLESYQRFHECETDRPVHYICGADNPDKRDSSIYRYRQRSCAAMQGRYSL